MKTSLCAAIVLASVLCAGCTDAQRCELQTGHSDPAFCYAHAAEINAALGIAGRTQADQFGMASQSLEGGLGSTQGLAEQNQRSAQMLIDQTQKFPRFQPPEPVAPVGVDQGWDSAPPGAASPGWGSQPQVPLAPTGFPATSGRRPEKVSSRC
jgi:hypothetical protein